MKRSLLPRKFPNMTRARWVDMLPGGLAWVGLVVVVSSAYYAPRALLWGVALLAGYVTVRFMLAGIATVWGLRMIGRWEAKNWRAEYDRLATSASLSLAAVHHLVIVPNYQEPLALLRTTLDHLADQRDAQTSFSVVLALEAAEPSATEKGALIRQEYGARFAHFFVTYHPAGLPGEKPCKSANLAWAGRWAKRELIDRQGYNIDHVVVTAMDVDTLWHPQYFESVGVLFATDARRYATYWQALLRYHRSVWTSTPLLRLLHAYSAAWELAYLAAPWWQALPMSSYSLSLRLLAGIGYWDTAVIADEWHMYLKSYFQQAGQQRLQPVFLPFSVCATGGNTLWAAITARYWQTFRHAWGAKEIGYTVTQMNTPSSVSFKDGTSLVWRVAHDNILAGAGWVVLFLGSQLPLVWHSDWVRAQMTTPPLIMLQASFAIMAALMIMLWVLDLRLRPARLHSWTLRERLFELVSLPLVGVMLVLCVALPVLHAQTRLLLGHSIRFRVTPKL